MCKSNEEEDEDKDEDSVWSDIFGTKVKNMNFKTDYRDNYNMQTFDNGIKLREQIQRVATWSLLGQETCCGAFTIFLLDAE